MFTTINTKTCVSTGSTTHDMIPEANPMTGKMNTETFQSLELPVPKSGLFMKLTRVVLTVLAILFTSGQLVESKALSSVGDFVWVDLNTNGLQDIGEPGVTNNSVFLYDTSTNLVQFASTDTNGLYRFNDVAAGQYFVAFVKPAGYVSFTILTNGGNTAIDNDSDFDARTAVFTVGGNETNLTIDAGLVIAQPSATFTKTAMDVPNGGIYYATQGEDIVYTYIFVNTGNTRFKFFSLFDDQKALLDGQLVWEDSSLCIGPGESITVKWTNLNLQASVTNLAEFCGRPVGPKCDDIGFGDICLPEEAIVLICPDPLVIPPSNITVECDSDYLTTNITGTISVTNQACDCPITNVTFTNTFSFSETCPQSFFITRHFQMQDSCGHDLIVTQVITVVDSTPPVLQNVPSNILVSCTNVPAAPTVTADDNCDTNVPVSLIESNEPGRCEGTYRIIRIWSATDDCFNVVSATQVVDVVDLIPPVLSGVPANTNVSCDAVPPPANVTASDSCSAAVVTNFSETLSQGPCANSYTLERVWTAWDACSNSVAATQLVFVTDTAAPVVLSIPTNETIDCIARVTLPDPGSVVATDNCSNAQALLVTVTTNDNGGTGLAGDPHIVRYTYTVEDECGNTTAATQIITQACSPSFTLQKDLVSPTGRPANVGESVTFTISASNSGDIVLGSFRLEDTYDLSRLSFISAQPPADFTSGGLVVWSNVGPLGIGGTVVVTAEFVAVGSTLPGFTTNDVVAFAFWTNGAPVGTRTSSAPVQIAAPGYDLVKRVVSPTNGRVNVGSQIVFSLNLTNTGDIAVNPDQLADTYDSIALSFTSSTVPPSATAPGLVIWSNLPTLLPGSNYSILIYFVGISNTYPASSTNTVEAQVSITNGLPLPPKTSSVPYAVVAPVTIGDYVWYDENTNGIQDVSEHGLTNYLVRLLDLNTNLVAQTYTDGTYLFTNILPGTYIIQFVPKTTSNVFTVQYASTNTAEDSDADPVTGMSAPVTFQPGETNNTIDAGFQRVNPVYALLNLVRGDNINGRGVVTWVTEGESGTAGFQLYRKVAAGQFVKVGGLLSSFGDHEGTRNYSVTDDAVDVGSTHEYRVVELENRGGKNYYGPFSVSIPAVPSAAPVGSGARAVASLGSSVAQKVVTPVVLASPVPVDAAKVHVSADGIYHVAASSLAKALGRTEAGMAALLASGSIGVSSEGQPVGCRVDASGILFFGTKKASRYSDHHVYLIGTSGGIPMGQDQVMSADVQESTTYSQSLELEENLIARPDLFDDNTADVWLWSAVAAGESFSTVFNADGSDSGAAPRLTVRLKGGISGVSYDAEIALNGVKIGNSTFNGLNAVEVQLEGGSLKNVGNVLQISSAGSDAGFFLLDSVTVNYSCTLASKGAGVVFAANGQEAITIAGFQATDVDVLDVTDAENPIVVTGVGITGDGAGGHQVSFMPAQRYGRFAAASSQERRTPDLIAPVSASSLKSSANQADSVIVAPASLKTSAQSLADYRNGRGLKTVVVDIEDIYNVFNDGSVDPAAIRSFLAFTRSNWTKAPKYLLIVGQGSLDWKNVLGNGDCLIPSLLTRTDYGLQASDKELGDLDGNGTLDVAVGRIPAGTPTEVLNAIAKIKAFEKGGAWRRKAVTLADNPDRSGDLAGMSDAYSAARMKNMAVNRIHLPSSAAQSVADTRSKLYGSLNGTGAGLLTYFGHSTHYRLAGEHLLGRDDVTGVLANESKPPVMLSVACLMDDFGTPGLDTLGETLVVSKSGSAAVIGPGQKVDVYEGALVVSATISALCENGAARLGDAFTIGYNNALAAGAGGSARAYNLLGDPALETTFKNALSAGGSLTLDFDGDGRSDISAYWPSGGQWRILHTTTGVNTPSQLGSSYAVAVAADYDGDGITDRAVYDRGNWIIVQSSNGQKITRNWGWSTAVPVPADYDADGKTDYAVFDRSTARWYISSSRTNTSRVVQWGTSAGIPVAGDYDGDGSADIAVYTPSKATWHILQSGNGQARVVSWGSKYAMPVPSDYDGDSKTDIAVYTPSTGIWSIKNSSDGATFQLSWGFKSAAPVPVDYDGDTKADLAVYETATGRWYIRQSSTGAGVVLVQGSSKAVPPTPQFQINRRYFPKP